MPQKNLQLIQFHYLSGPFHFPNRNQLKAFLLKLFKIENVQIEHINYIFCSDEYLHDINRKYLKHNTYTDIITFPLSIMGEAMVSDIYISVERVKENARVFQVPFLNELYRVIFHGALHLCGYKDKTPSEQKTMRSKEEQYLKSFLKKTLSN